ncbi:MAG: efflux RND transporter permease subunit [Candidatus Eremiobacteraeota bacterium]|nr:efflux RND transporter permease subunit [Candidatus Eremiobacteraeota bacterium]
MDLAAFSIRQERAIAFLTAALTVAGVVAYVRTPAAIFPEMRFSRIDVVADAGNLPPEQVRVAVTMPLERAFLGLPSVERVLATSAQGSSELLIQFDSNTNAVTDLQYVNGAIEQTRGVLPGGSGIEANVLTPQTEPVVSYAVTSSMLSQTLIREYAQRSIVPALYGIVGLGRILVAGGAQREYHVELDPAALAQAGVSAQDVGNAIAQANDVEAVGLAENASQRSIILVDARLRNAEQIARIAVATKQGGAIALGSLGDVRLGVAPLTDQVAYDATHSVSLNFYALPAADNVAMAQEVKARLAALTRELPAGVTLHRYWDATDLVTASQESLRDAILAGAALALGVIFFFLRNARMTLVAALVIPSAMAIAVLAISLLGQTLNIMSVGGLAIAVGLIIDDAIVVVEGIARTLHDRRQPVRDAVVATMHRLIAPMTASTLTTVVVFLPLILLGGVSGAFFRALALTLTCALLVSLALAIFVTPLLFRLILHRQVTYDENPGIARVLARYEPLLRWALARPRAVYGAAGVILAVTMVLLAILPSDFLPQLDEGQFEIDYRMPVGTTLGASDAAALAIERAVISDPAVVSEGRFTGIDTNGFSPTPVRSGILRVKLAPLNARAPFDAVADRLRDRISAAVPAAILDVHQILEDLINDVSGAPAPIQVVLSGPDQTTLVAIATRLADEMQKPGGVTDVFSGVTQDDPTIRVEPNFSRLVRGGSDTAALATALAAGTQGSVVTSLPETTMTVPVRVRVASAQAGFPRSLALAQGAIPSTLFARAVVDRNSTDVTEINGQRVMIVTANTSGGSLSAAVGTVRRAIARANLPAGYHASIEGAYRAQQESFRQFALVIALAIGLVFFVMLSSFRSFRQPLVVLAAVPLAPIGVALGLTLTRTPFNVSSFMGLLMLVGLVVKNGILLIDAANRRRAEGSDVTTALVLAGRERLRPILMTTFAAIGGLLPLAFGIGAGAAMERPLAIAVVGGLSTATLFTLVLIPVLYATFCGREAMAV